MIIRFAKTIVALASLVVAVPVMACDFKPTGQGDSVQALLEKFQVRADIRDNAVPANQLVAAVSQIVGPRIQQAGCTSDQFQQALYAANRWEPNTMVPLSGQMAAVWFSSPQRPSAVVQPAAPTLSAEAIEARIESLIETRLRATGKTLERIDNVLLPGLEKKLEEAKAYAEVAEKSAKAAKGSEEAAAKSAKAADDSATKAGQSAGQASTSANAAKGSAAAAARSETNAATAATDAQKWAMHSQQWGQHVEARVTGIDVRSWIGAVTGVAALGLFLFFFFSPHQRIKTWWKWRREEKKLAAVVAQSEAGPSPWSKAA